MTPADGAVDLKTVEVGTLGTPKRALLLGVEGPGLGDVSLSHADLRVRIPMDMGMDSLNVAAAAAVALYELRSQGGR